MTSGDVDGDRNDALFEALEVWLMTTPTTTTTATPNTDVGAPATSYSTLSDSTFFPGAIERIKRLNQLSEFCNVFCTAEIEKSLADIDSEAKARGDVVLGKAEEELPTSSHRSDQRPKKATRTTTTNQTCKIPLTSTAAAMSATTAGDSQYGRFVGVPQFSAGSTTRAREGAAKGITFRSAKQIRNGHLEKDQTFSFSGSASPDNQRFGKLAGARSITQDLPADSPFGAFPSHGLFGLPKSATKPLFDPPMTTYGTNKAQDCTTMGKFGLRLVEDDEEKRWKMTEPPKFVGL